MSALSVRLPKSLHRAAREVAAQDGVSINQLIASALGEKIAALKTVEFLRERGHGADASDLAAVLALVPDAEPEDYDRFPAAPTPQ
jgi:hypothetical protein